ncbi:MFS transporter [Aliidongia dinghuensis]|uniref:MFS transporter n=1 Tax=Aliidongia dinghuensis TaxID=1867774 RepID=A0A8J2YXD1_9PROT|nr:MFS transporter [Aliidongia dinghuensis]GGF33082.1 MFS transporter [Aliidongia dinghuensis]
MSDHTPAPRFWAPISVLLLGAFVVALDNFIVNVAIPRLKADFNTGYGTIQLIIVAYGLAYGMSLVTGGRLGDLYGRKRMYLLGFAGFTLASLLCGLAPSPAFLVAARLLQGITGAVLHPQIVAMLRVQMAPERRRFAFALYGSALGLGAIAGQLLGGALVDWDWLGLGWRLVFLVNLPVGLIAVPAAALLLDETLRAKRVRFDVPGMALAALTLGAVLTPLILGREAGWPLWTWASFAVSLPLGGAFVRRERELSWMGRAPLVDFRLFRAPAFVSGLLLSGTFFTTLNSFYMALTLLEQLGLGASAFETGLVFLPLGLTFLVGTLAAVRLGGRRTLDLGLLFTLAGYGLLFSVGHVVGPDWPVRALVPGLAVLGLGQGLFITPLLNVILARVDAAEAGSAAGVLATAQQTGGALGIAIVGLLFFGALDGGVGGFRHGFEHVAEYAFGVSLVCLVLLRRLDQSHRRAASVGVEPA